MYDQGLEGPVQNLPKQNTVTRDVAGTGCGGTEIVDEIDRVYSVELVGEMESPGSEIVVWRGSGQRVSREQHVVGLQILDYQRKKNGAGANERGTERRDISERDGAETGMNVVLGACTEEEDKPMEISGAWKCWVLPFVHGFDLVGFRYKRVEEGTRERERNSQSQRKHTFLAPLTHKCETLVNHVYSVASAGSVTLSWSQGAMIQERSLRFRPR